MTITVSLVLKGDLLDPANLTEAIGVAPSKSHLKGKIWTTVTGKVVREKIGYWGWTSDFLEPEQTDPLDCPCTLTDAVALLCKQFPRFPALSEMKGVTEAYIHFVVLANADESTSRSEVNFKFTSGDCLALGRFGLPLYITTGMVGLRTNGVRH